MRPATSTSTWAPWAHSCPKTDPARGDNARERTHGGKERGGRRAFGHRRRRPDVPDDFGDLGVFDALDVLRDLGVPDDLPVDLLVDLLVDLVDRAGEEPPTAPPVTRRTASASSPLLILDRPSIPRSRAIAYSS
ncbi:hypothetical protein GCM10022214_14250 [Actinomadura miaoliensis]|uniref:Uncharacterized protein n=1 Tax=Actinomadura miaoliensis TaxID=430685 RepID=A0ABP7V9R4_9ACTN